MYIKDNKLDMHTSWRSWDLFAGLPENLGGMTRLLEYTTEWINAIKKPEQSEVKPGKTLMQKVRGFTFILII